MQAPALRGRRPGFGWRALASVCALAGVAANAAAEVVSVDILARSDVLAGRAFGEAGAYEQLSGLIRFRLDPRDPANAKIVDLTHAPRDGRGRVTAAADFTVLRPKDPLKGRGLALLEVSNRGGKAALRYFNGAEPSGYEPEAFGDYGDGFLMRLGLTLIWVGWQFDVPAESGLLRLFAPVASDGGQPIHGLVRSDWVVDFPVNVLALGHRDHWAYPVANAADVRNALTRRSGREAERELVPRDRWDFGRWDGGALIPDPSHIYSPRGFQSGYIYELVYVARDPRVVGAGLAAVRDTLAYAKYDPDSLFPVEQGIGFGVSQTGRFLRHFLYQGFNEDEQGRRVFDGLLIHSAGAGRGSFNHRFAQPSRDAHRYSAFFYPTDLFPFSGRVQHDPVTDRSDGLLAAYPDRASLPRIMYTNTGYEYWGRAASLLHTSVDGERDVELLPAERLYLLASGQHYVGRWPPSPVSRLPGSRAYQGNPLDFLVNLRALLQALVEWVTEDREPPASAHPMLRARTLVPVAELEFPPIPRLRVPEAAHVAYRADYGSAWDRGIVTRQPPELGPAFPVFVPQVDGLGNEIAGIRNIEVAVPVATYSPWSLRSGLHSEHELADFTGLFVPLPRTEAEAEASADPRPPVDVLYGSRNEYMQRVEKAAGLLVQQRLLLDEDRTRVARRAGQLWDWIAALD